jgi:hypothetical protein
MGALSEGRIPLPGGFGIAIIITLIIDASIKKKVEARKSDNVDV